jgi:hypothetical protein
MNSIVNEGNQLPSNGEGFTNVVRPRLPSRARKSPSVPLGPTRRRRSGVISPRPFGVTQGQMGPTLRVADGEDHVSSLGEFERMVFVVNGFQLGP